MLGIDDNLLFQPLSIALLRVSDVDPHADDWSGDDLEKQIVQAGHNVCIRKIVRNELAAISGQVRQWSLQPDIDVVVTIGGTGFTERDVMIEAVEPLFDKRLDGFSVLTHKLSCEAIGLPTLLHRTCAGLTHGTLVFCLPESMGAAKQIWDEIVQGALDSRYRPASLVDLIPRFKE